MASSVSRFSVKPKTCIRKTAPMSESGIATSGISTERNEPRNRKITIDDDDQRVDQRLDHLVDGAGNIGGRVVGHAGLHAGGQILLDRVHLAWTRLMTSSEFAFGKTQMPMKTAFSLLKRTSES